MRITTGSKFIHRDNPNFYLYQAMVELFPNHNNPNKAHQLALWEAGDTPLVDRGPRPETGPDLTAIQLLVATSVASQIETYFASCNPDKYAIYTYLACCALDPKVGISDHAPDASLGDLMLALFNAGKGIYHYASNVLIDQTNIDPRLAVLSLEANCNRHNLHSLRMPTGNGEDVFYSCTPLEHYPVFNNVTYIPALKGYYGIVGKGGRADG